ncbi:MAG: hypothetical protein RLZZ385_2373 [Pseudomonadota bacterium]|jgi:PAS domain S-box-containing protein
MTPTRLPRKKPPPPFLVQWLMIFSPLLILCIGVNLYLLIAQPVPMFRIVRYVAVVSTFGVLSGIVSWRFARTLQKLRLAERELRRSLRLREAFMGKAPAGLFAKDLRGHYLYANEAWARITGLTEKTVEGKTDGDIFDPATAAALQAQDRQIIAGDKAIEFRDSFASVNGDEYFEVTRFPLHASDGRINSIGAVALNVTDKVLAEKALAASENRFATLLDLAPNAIIISDRNGDISLVNKQAADLFGMSDRELLNRNVDDLIPVASRDRHRQYRAQYIGQPATRVMGSHLKMEGQRGNGETFPIEVALSPVRSGNELMIMSIVRDITSQKQAMAALEESAARLQELNRQLESERANLERRVAERTEELEQARQVAEAANRAKSSFLATMSHEIRTPMNGVIGTIDVLRQSSLRPRQLEQIEIIKDSAFSLLTVIDDILDFSKIEADRIALEQEPVVLAYLTESICNAMQPLAQKKKVELSFHRDLGLPAAILSDAVRLRQIVTNLVGNAIKFSGGREGLTGRVQARFEPAGSERLQITVVDNGIGMSEAARLAVFEPFSQADSSTTRRFGGTGLGLPITKRLVELMGGELTVQSEEGQGSTFVVRLPMAATDKPGVEEFADDLRDMTCLIHATDPVIATDWAAYCQHLGARTRLLPQPPVPGSFTWGAGEGDRQIVVIALESGLPVQQYHKLLASMDGPMLRHIVVVRPLHHDKASFPAEKLTLIDWQPNMTSVLRDVVSAVQGRLAGELAELDAETESPGLLTRDEAIASGRLVLVAEDNDINQKVIRNQLELLGYASDIAGNGEEALEYWCRNRYALLLTDLHMPVMDGYELTAAIRSQEALKADGQDHLPILAFTANATKGERARCIEAGMDDYLPKPVPLENLREKLEKWRRQPEVTESLTALASGADSQDPSHPVYDGAMLPSLVGDDGVVLAGFQNDFLRSAQQTADAIYSASDAADWLRVGDLAHSLKSSSRAIGAMALGETCAGLEQAGRCHDGPAVERLLGRFRDDMTLAVRAIRQALAGVSETRETAPLNKETT